MRRVFPPLVSYVLTNGGVGGRGARGKSVIIGKTREKELPRKSGTRAPCRTAIMETPQSTSGF